MYNAVASDPRLKSADNNKELSLANINRFDRKFFYHIHAFSSSYLNLFYLSLNVCIGDFPNFQQPKYVGSFSLDVHRNYHHDFSELRYLALPLSPPNTGSCRWKVEYNLRKGIKNAVVKDELSVKNKMLDDLLTWIVQERANKNRTIINPEKLDAPIDLDFVCFRG